MSEVLQIVSLWKKAKARDEAVFLATVVQVNGSSYRKPGARMLVTASGERAGSISGGCLEAEVTQRIGWLTRSGPIVHRYSSTFDDDSDETPYGLGCGGTIWVLMEPDPQAGVVLKAMEQAALGDEVSVVVAGLQADHCGTIAMVDAPFLERCHANGHEGQGKVEAALFAGHVDLAERALREDRFLAGAVQSGYELPGFVCVPVSPPPRLIVFGAGQDAQPLVSIAAQLGWRVEVADARSPLLRRERFPGASSFRPLVFEGEDGEEQGRLKLRASELRLQRSNLAVLLTHSYELDRALLEILLPQSLSYLGILGPMHRTQRLLSEVAPAIGFTPQQCLSRVRAPAGLDLGVGDASTIALAIVSEMQACLAGTGGVIERKRG